MEREAAYYRALARRQHLERFLASLPDGYRGLSFDTFVRETGNAEALAAAQRLQKGEFLYLHGQPGRGKTHLAVAAARRLVEGGLAGLFLGEAAYFEALYQAFRGEGKAPEYSQAEVVVLDDLAKIRPSDFAYQTLYALLEQREEPDRDQQLHACAGRPAPGGRGQGSGAGPDQPAGQGVHPRGHWPGPAGQPDSETTRLL